MVVYEVDSGCQTGGRGGGLHAIKEEAQLCRRGRTRFPFPVIASPEHFRRRGGNHKIIFPREGKRLEGRLWGSRWLQDESGG